MKNNNNNNYYKNNNNYNNKKKIKLNKNKIPNSIIIIKVKITTTTNIK